MSTDSDKDFFISYTSADKKWAEWIAWQLEEAQYSTILQAWDFRPGMNFVLEMDKAASSSRATRRFRRASYVIVAWPSRGTTLAGVRLYETQHRLILLVKCSSVL